MAIALLPGDNNAAPETRRWSQELQLLNSKWKSAQRCRCSGRWELPCFNAQKNVRSLSDLSAKRDAAVGKSRADTGEL
jgi:hypothetical protein